MKKKTKEELIIENTKLEQSNKAYYDADLKMRSEFAKAFGWVQSRDGSYYYGNIKKDGDISWSEIFTQVGRLLAKQTQFDFEEGHRQFRETTNNLFSRIKQLEEKENNDK